MKVTITATNHTDTHRDILETVFSPIRDELRAMGHLMAEGPAVHMHIKETLYRWIIKGVLQGYDVEYAWSNTLGHTVSGTIRLEGQFYSFAINQDYWWANHLEW